MILAHNTTELCELEFKTLILSWKIAILVILPTAMVGKQFVPYEDLMGHHVPVLGFVQQIQLLNQFFYVNK